MSFIIVTFKVFFFFVKSNISIHFGFPRITTTHKMFKNMNNI